MMRPALLLSVAFAFVAAPASAAALRIDKLEKLPSLDGVPGEWPRELGKLGATKGTASAADLSGKAAVAYDDKDVYIAVDVTDDVFKGGAGGDRVELTLVVGSQETTVVLVPGLPGKSAGKATVGGADVKGAKVVEAPRKGGWTLEAKVPWSAIAGASTLRVGLRGGVFVHDVDGGSVDAVIGTHNTQQGSSLPAILTTPEQALTDGLIKDKKLSSSPAFQGTANVVGDGMLERVMVFDNYLVVLGPTFRKGTEYYYADMNVSGSAMKVLGLETRDLDGDGRHDLVFRKRFTKSGSKTSRDVLQAQSFGTADTPEVVFIHEIGITNPKGNITNEVGFSSENNTTVITIRPGAAKGLEEATYDEPREASFDGLLLPWGSIESQTYKWKGKGFTKASEKTRAKPAGATETPVAPPTPEKPPAAPPPPDTAKVYALYKKDRGISGSARFDLSGDLEGDTKIERVVVHDAKAPELAVFGPGHKKGAGYSFTTLPFASGSDIKNVSLRDATGDKKAEIVVRGVLKAKGPKNEEVEREIELVYRVSAEGVKRVFGAEVGRAMGKNKIIGSIAYESQKGSFFVVLSAGKAVGFTKESYPFNQDTSAVGGLEPLLLPWSDTKTLRYKWTGSGFEKQ
ncbi:MAG: hypothetical protein JNL21_20775 [Myxococcales bacterium]|nr:hypothetical protein [Myxococcales bacterium]